MEYSLLYQHHFSLFYVISLFLHMFISCIHFLRCSMYPPQHSHLIHLLSLFTLVYVTPVLVPLIALWTFIDCDWCMCDGESMSKYCLLFPDDIHDTSISSSSHHVSSQLTKVPVLSLSQSPRKLSQSDSPRMTHMQRSFSSTEGGRCLPSTPQRNSSVIVRHRQSPGSEEGNQGEAEMDVAANLLLGEEAFFPEFSDDIFGGTTEVEKASHHSVMDGDDMTCEEGQREVHAAMEHDIETRKVCLLDEILMSILCRIHSALQIAPSQCTVSYRSLFRRSQN